MQSIVVKIMYSLKDNMMTRTLEIAEVDLKSNSNCLKVEYVVKDVNNLNIVFQDKIVCKFT